MARVKILAALFAALSIACGGSGGSNGGGGNSAAGGRGQGGAAGGGGGASCAKGPGAVDQSSLAHGGDAVEMPFGQSFEVGKAGVLVGVEVSLASCDGELPSGATFELTVTDSAGQMLGNATLDASMFPTSCPPPALVGETKGAGYFDLTKACIQVTVGEKLVFALAANGVPAGVCDVSARTCMSGKNGVCMQDDQCYFAIDSPAAGRDAYANGSVIEDAMTVATDDLAFKTFVE